MFEFPCGGYQLKPIEPAVAGQLNTIDVERAIRPFSLVLVGTFEGWIPIPGWLPTQGLRIANFAILTTLHQPTNPAMTFDVPVPAALQGFEVLVQAMELDTQALSNLQRVRFQ